MNKSNNYYLQRYIVTVILFLTVFLQADNGNGRKLENFKAKSCIVSEFDEVSNRTQFIRDDYKLRNNIFIDDESNSNTDDWGKLDSKFIDPRCYDLQSLIDAIGSLDPNDIIGPNGYGDQNYISPEYYLPYTIRFENDPEFATAPAQVVKIEQVLDPNLEIRSLQLGNFGFGEYIFEVPDNRISYQTRIDLRDSLGIYFDVLAGFDMGKGILYWELRSTDPETGGLPQDPYAGFLHVNDSTGVGEGFVSYSIKAKKEVVTNDTIHAEAKIVFDINAPINTPRIFNTIDIEKPISHVDTCYAVNDSLLIVKWSKAPELAGSGIKNYSIYYRKNDNPFDVWLSNTKEDSAYFEVEDDGRYEFFSIATSNVNNVENFRLNGQNRVLKSL